MYLLISLLAVLPWLFVLLVLGCGLAHAVLARPATLRACKLALLADLAVTVVGALVTIRVDPEDGPSAALAQVVLSLLFSLGLAIPGLMLMAVGEYRRSPTD